MVSFSLCNNWRSIPRAFRIHAFHCDNIRPTIRARGSLVLFGCSTWLKVQATRMACWCRAVSNCILWWMDICDLHGCSQLARYIHDFISGGHDSMDNRMHCAQPPECYSYYVAQAIRFCVLCGPGTSGLLFHSTQGSPCCRRYVSP
jgi:hypothetical protein